MMLTEQPNTSGIYDVLTHASKTLAFIRTIELESNRWPQGERGATFERLQIQARRRQPICSTAICYSWYRQNIFNLQTKSHLDSEWTCSILGWCCNILGWCCWSKTPRNPSIPRIWPWGFALLLKKQSHACGDSIHELQHSTHGSPPMHIRQRGTASRIGACTLRKELEFFAVTNRFASCKTKDPPLITLVLGKEGNGLWFWRAIQWVPHVYRNGWPHSVTTSSSISAIMNHALRSLSISCTKKG